MRKRLFAVFTVAAFACVIAGYAGGSVVHRKVDGQAPKATVRQMSSLPAAPGYKGRKFDGFGRLVFDDQKLEVECPVQTDKVGVILVTGQSNASNSAQAVFTTKYPWNVVNFFEGRCYAAASPLLGSENEKGEFITPMADACCDRRFRNRRVKGFSMGIWRRLERHDHVNARHFEGSLPGYGCGLAPGRS
jgi:hypothetical protein